MKRNNVFTMLVLMVLLSVLCINNVNAQKNNKKITITGTVLDADKNPVVNAIVMVDGEKTNFVTDANGKYKIKVKPTAAKIGLFTFGFGMKEVEITGRSQIDFNFAKSGTDQAVGKDAAAGEEGVNTGYGYIKNKNTVTQVNKIDGKKKKYASYSSISDMIIREVSGVRYSGGEYIIQDSKNLFGAVAALLVLDGVPVPTFDNISPTQVESIEVLKNTAAAMYGSRASGGVIVIKTKIEN